MCVYVCVCVCAYINNCDQLCNIEPYQHVYFDSSVTIIN